jgi:hypothetical protein
MRGRPRYQWGIAVILSILLAWSVVGVSAEPVPDLTGTWEMSSKERYALSEGFVNTTSDPNSYHIFAQDGRVLAGNETYLDYKTGAHISDSFPAVVSPDGQTFFKDEVSSGISFGELVSDHELYNYMIFVDQNLSVIVSHMVKEGTTSAPEKPVPDIVGSWNLTHKHSNGVNTTGLLTIKEQKGRIWSGTEQIRDDDGSMIELEMVGVIGDSGRVYGVSQNGAFMFGSMTGDAVIESAFLIPGDTDGTFVVERWITKNETPVPESDVSYPDITGEWEITDRKVIQDGTITDVGPVSSEWMSYANQTGRFVTAIRHTTENGSPQEMQSSVIFRTPDEAYLTNAQSSLVQYHVIDNSTIEAVVNKKDGKALLYLDELKRK